MPDPTRSRTGPWSVTTVRGRWTALLGAALLLAGLWWRYPLVAGLGGALLLVVLVEVVAVVLARDVGVERTVTPGVVRRHELAEGVLRVTGRRSRGLVRLDAADTVDGSLVTVRLPDGVRGVSSEVRYRVPTPRRGLVEVGPLRLRRYGLAGMAAATREVGGIDRVRVLPREVPLAGVLPGRTRATAGSDAGGELGGTDLVGLHEYAMGDDLRRLHWATSARTGRLMVREDADPAEPRVCVLLDDRRVGYYGAGQPLDAFEEAVETAAALCRTTTEHGHPLLFRTLSGRHEVNVPGSSEPAPEARELEWLLAEVAPAAETTVAPVHRPGYDVVVAVTGVGADPRQLAQVLGGATQVLAVVDAASMIAVGQEAGLLVLRGAGSWSLAAAWDDAVARA